MHTEGWRRLWELTKWVVSIAVGLWCANAFAQTLPPPSNDSTPTAGQIVVGLLLAGGITGGSTFGFLSALEWVYRGFRPLPTAPTEETPPLVLNTPESAQAPLPEQRPALPHPDNQQS